MSDTRETLEQIRDLLKSDPPENKKALRLVKNLLIQGVCARDLDVPRNAGILILDRLVRSVLAGDQAHQAHLGRLIRQIRTSQTFDSESISAHLEAIVPGIAGKTAQVCTTDAPPPFSAELVRAAFLTLGGKALNALFPPGKECSWESMYLQLGSLINRERRLRSNWQREQLELQELLAETARTLAETLRLLKTDASDADQLADRLSQNDPVSDFATVWETLLNSIQKHQDRVQEVRGRLKDGRQAEEQFRELLRQAEWELQDTRDEKLMDVFTNLPNRFGLLAYMERAMQHHLEGAAGFTTISILFDEYTDIVEELGRNRTNQLMGSLAKRLTAETGSGNYLARFNDEIFALFCPDMEEAEAVALATYLRNFLDYTRFELQDAVLSVRASFGVVRHEKGESAESLLGLATMAAKKASEEETDRIHTIPPRQKPPPPPPPPRKRLFGF